MDRFLFCFITASLSSLLWPCLLSVGVTMLLGLAGLLLWSTSKTLSGFCLGITWMLSLGHWLSMTQPEPALFLQPVTVTGEVSTVVSGPAPVKFILEIIKVESSKGEGREGSLISKPVQVRLNWMSPDWVLKQGQIVQLQVKLKPRWGLLNEAGFNYQQWLFSENITATGYVKSGVENLLLSGAASLRQKITDTLLSISEPEIRWLLALVIGYRGKLSDSDWELLQKTGTAHLVAISGMHLGMVALWSYWLFAALMSVCNFVSRRVLLANVRLIAVTLTLFVTFGYLHLAGFAIPTWRAWLMLLLLWALMVTQLNWSAGRFILVSLWLFIVLFPLSIFSISFWLSFIAIFLLWFIIWRLPGSGLSFSAKLRFFVSLQAIISFLMWPFIVLFFGGGSLLSPLINLLAIPFVTLCLLPLSILATLCYIVEPGSGLVFVEWILKLFSFSEDGLKQLAQWQFNWVAISQVNLMNFSFVLLALVLCCLPRGLIPRPFYGLFLLPFLTRNAGLAEQQWQLDVLDVGHGLSVVIRKSNKATVYDVGAAYPDGMNMAEAVLIPVLDNANIETIDRVIISHNDIDHAGALPALLQQKRVLALNQSHYGCQKGDKWQWLGLHFEVLWPDVNYQGLLGRDNNQSCVIMLSDKHRKILLTGDIEREVEMLLADWHQSGKINLHADILLAPHHGSKTSSSSPFLLAVKPHYVIVSSGFMNRWSMPADVVSKRIGKINATLFNTAEDGQISVRLGSDGQLQVLSWRKDIQARWFLLPN